MHNFVHVMLNGTPAALRIEALWKVRNRVYGLAVVTHAQAGI